MRGFVCPASAIPDKFHYVSESPIAPSHGAPGDVELDPSTRQWKRTEFPTKLPSTRDEVLHLGRVLDLLLREVDSSRTPATADPADSASGSPDGERSHVPGHRRVLPFTPSCVQGCGRRSAQPFGRSQKVS